MLWNGFCWAFGCGDDFCFKFFGINELHLHNKYLEILFIIYNSESSEASRNRLVCLFGLKTINKNLINSNFESKRCEPIWNLSTECAVISWFAASIEMLDSDANTIIRMAVLLWRNQSHEKVLQPIFELLTCAPFVVAQQKMREKQFIFIQNIFYVKCLPISSPHMASGRA